MNEDQNAANNSQELEQKVQSDNKMPVSSGMLAIGAIVLVVALGGIAVFANRGTDATNSSAQVVTASPEASTTGDNNVEGTTQTEDEVGETVNIALEAGSFFYSPKEIRVKKGQKVKITMTSKDMMHDFVVDELGVKIPITKSGQSNVVEFTPTKTGTFEYYCSVGEHRKMGQVGKIIISE